MRDKILQAIKELRDSSKKRNFSQTFDIIIGLKELDTKKPENKFSESVFLPRGRGKEADVVVFSDSLKDLDCQIVTSSDIQNLIRNRREVKKLVSETEFFLSEAPMMPLIGKSLGQFLAPRGKMPRMISGDAKPLVDRLKSSVKVSVKDSPLIQCMVGKEDMKDEEIIENVEAVVAFLETKLPKGKHNINDILLKLTMSKPVKVL